LTLRQMLKSVPVVKRYFGMSVAWRSDPFNWVDVGSCICCWLTFGVLGSSATLGRGRGGGGGGGPRELLFVATVFFLGLKFLGFAKGMGIKLATFIILLQEIIGQTQTYIFVFAVIISLFSLMCVRPGRSLASTCWSCYPQ